MMKLSKRMKNIMLALGLVTSSFACLISSTFAWIVTNNNISFSNTAGYTQGAYFARGKGTSDDPYILNAPIHLYNLSWLQYLGKFDDEVVYFELESDLDLEGTEYQKLPPIGTKEHPFIGNFNGAGHTISGLKTCNALGSGENEILRKPSNISLDNFKADALGVFGYVESYKGTVPASEEGSMVKDFNLKNYTVISSTKDVLVGAVAGYLDGEVSGIKVSNEDSGISFKIGSGSSTSTGYDLTEYGLVGHATEKCLSTISEDSIQIYNPYVSDGESSDGSSGNDTLWGGSFNAGGLSSRLTTFKGDSANQEELRWQNNLKQKIGYYNMDGEMVDDTDEYEYYTEDELAVGATQWSDSLKGKSTFTSDNEYLSGSIDRPKEKGWTDIQFSLGGGGGGSSDNPGDNPDNPDDSGGGGGSSSGETPATDAIDPKDPYIAPSMAPGNYGYLVVYNWGNIAGLAPNYDGPVNIQQASVAHFTRDEQTYIVSLGNKVFGNWNTGEGLGVQLNSGCKYIFQDRGIYLRLVDEDNIRQSLKFYLVYNGTGFIMSSNKSRANVNFVTINGIGYIRVDLDKIPSGRSFEPNVSSIPLRGDFSEFKRESASYSRTQYASTFTGVRYFYCPDGQDLQKTPASLTSESPTLFELLPGNFLKCIVGYNNYSLGSWSYSLNTNLEDVIVLGKHSSPTDSSTVKVVEDDRLRLFINGTASNYYVYCDGTTFRYTADTTKLNVTYDPEGRVRAVVELDPAQIGDNEWVQKNYSRKHDETVGGTYLPLNVYETSTIPAEDASFWNSNSITPSQYYPKPTNSGYVVGGTKGYTYDEDSGAVSYQSAYEFKNTNLFGGNSFAVTTRTASSNGYAAVNDGNVGALGLERYTTSKNELAGNTSSFLRFTGGEVSADKVIKADSVLFNKHIYSDYELPESTLDFQVENKGIFNMFASSSSNGGACTGFASFYQIFRGEVTRGEEDDATIIQNGVSEIRRISKIYTSASDEAAIYEYYDVEGYYKYNSASGSYDSVAATTGYTVAFDMSWIESFNGSASGCYYFEWPVCPGEYALGAVPSSPEDEPIDHGYICYVGIGAPSGIIPGTQIFEKYVQTTKSFTVVEGIYFVEDVEATASVSDSLVFAIDAGFVGDITIESGGEGTTIINGFDSDSMELTYKKYEMVVKKAGEDPPENALGTNPISTKVTTVERVTDFVVAANGNVTERTATWTTIDDGEPVKTGTAGLTARTSHFGEETPMIVFYYVYVSTDEIQLTIGITSVESGETYAVSKINVTIVPESDINVTFIRIDEDTYDVYLNGTKVTEINTPIEIKATA